MKTDSRPLEFLESVCSAAVRARCESGAGVGAWAEGPRPWCAPARSFAGRVLLLALLAVPAYAGNLAPTFDLRPANTQSPLFTNGSFETGAHNASSVQVVSSGSTAIAGWSVTSGSVDWIQPPVWAAQSGTYSLDMNGNGPGEIAQSFATVSGTTYLVQFYLAANTYPWGTTTVTLSANATGGSSASYTVNVVPTVNWTLQSYTFTATGAATTLTFAGDPNSGASGPALDNVSVSAVGGIPANGAQCKKEGWQLMSNPVTGMPFRNQGACVSYYARSGQVPIGS